MAEIFDYHIRADHDLSDAGPSLLMIGETPWIAWTGIGNRFPNVMPIRRNPDGALWFDRDRKLTIEGQRTNGGVALGHLWGGAALMCSQDHEPATLVGYHVAEDWDDWEAEQDLDFVALGQSSQYAPALRWWVSELNMAWTGEDQRLNVAPLAFVENQWGFDFERKFTSEYSETSEYGPALAWRGGPNRLYMAWTGEGEGELNVMYSPGGLLGDPPPHIAHFDRSTKHIFRSETSEAAPSLYMTGGAMHLAYRGSGNTNINLLLADADDGFAVIHKNTSAHTTPHSPAFASFWGRRWIAYTGEDEHLYLARISSAWA